ncbi:MAG: translation initiation factor IF-3 [Gemmatimonadetes bacterium]|nr:translation initiation factor IF-3 [Gemmatimonadota bacterium]
MRINDRIRISPVRVIDEEGEMLGVMSIEEARGLADDRGIDLVEIAPGSRPPVCRLMDYGKFKYDQNKKERKARSAQHRMQQKEVKVRPKIEEHDLQFKMRHARKFLEARDRVKLTLFFRGREITHQDLGTRVLRRMAEELSDVSTVESGPRMEGRTMVVHLIPLSQAKKGQASAKQESGKNAGDASREEAS